MKTLGQIAKEGNTTYTRMHHLAKHHGIKAEITSGSFSLYGPMAAARLIALSEAIDAKHRKNKKPHIVTPAETSFFTVADHARWLGVSPARVDQAIKALGIIQTEEFNGERAYRAELSDAVGRVALNLARQAGEVIEPDRSEQAANWEGYVSSLEGVALTTKKPLHEVTAAARAIGAKSVRTHADGRELFDQQTTQAILNELTRRNKAGEVGQFKAA